MPGIAEHYTQLAVVLLIVILFIPSLFKRLIAQSSSPLDNIPGPPPTGSWLNGHVRRLYNIAGWDFYRDICDTYGQVVKLDGPFGTRWLFVSDPVALHHIVVKQQHIFEETSLFLALSNLLFGKGLLATIGEHHKKQRKLLNPVFSINHMRHMLPIFYQVTDRLIYAIMSRVTDGPRTIDMLAWMSRTALEIVGLGGLGYSFDSLTEDTQNAYGDAIKSVGPTVFDMLFVRYTLPYIHNIGSPRFRRWVVERVPNRRVQKMRELIDTMDAVARDLFRSKKAALEKGENAVLQQIGEGKDIISRLLKANMVASEQDKLPDEEVIAQMSTLVFAATDTTSGALAHIMHLLAQNPATQERLRREIIDAQGAVGGDHLSFETLSTLPYLDAVCRETLRLYPPLPMILKTTREDTVLPLGTPVRGRDGTLVHEIPIPTNTNVMVGILASNRNPALWGASADEWKPERWLRALPEAVVDAHVPGVYSHLMTFFGGGRACIGFKFAQMEMKAVLVALLPKVKLSLAPELEQPIVWNMAGVQYPSLGYEAKAELPLRVELVSKGG